MALTAVAAIAALLGGCADPGAAPAATTTAAAPWPTAQARLSDAESRAVFDRAAAAISAQRTMAVNFSYERTDGYCVAQLLNPTIRVDLRDPARPAASLALSILASNVAVDGKVFRQQADPGGQSTVWVADAEPRTPLQFVLWKPGAAGSAVAYLGTEPVAGVATRHYRVFDPATYAGPTSATAAGTPAGAPTPCRTPGGTASGAGAATQPGAGTATQPGGTAPGGIGDYDDFWLGDDGAPRRIVSVLGELRLTSASITYGGDLRIDIPDVSKAITAQEYDRRATSSASAPAR